MFLSEKHIMYLSIMFMFSLEKHNTLDFEAFISVAYLILVIEYDADFVSYLILGG